MKSIAIVQNLQLDAYRLRAFREENRHLKDQMQAA